MSTHLPKGVRVLRDCRGAAAVELGLLLPVCFIVLFALLDLGRLGFAMACLADAAQEGAQYASRHGPASGAAVTDDQIKAFVSTHLASYAAPTQVAVTVQWTAANPSQQTVTVTTTYQFAFLANLVPAPSVTLSGTSSMIVL